MNSISSAVERGEKVNINYSLIKINNMYSSCPIAVSIFLRIANPNDSVVVY